MIITCNNTSVIRMWSLLGQLLCVTNIEHPLPYRWRLTLDDDSKRKIKMLNSLRIMKEI